MLLGPVARVAGRAGQAGQEPVTILEIPASGEIVETTVKLDMASRYTLVVSGTYRYDVGEPGEFADAQFREDDNDAYSIRWNSVEIDGVASTADTFDLVNHSYGYYIIGTGSVLQLRIVDEPNAYGDNAGSLTATLFPFRQGVDRDPFANAVVGYDARGQGNTHRDPSWVLGAPSCGTYDLSLGGGYVIVDMGEGEGVADQEGVDLRVYESSSACGGGSASAYEVFVSEGPEGPWTAIGTASGVAAFDLSGSGLSTVRYIRVEDRASASPTQTPGADIDAFEAIHLAEPPSQIQLVLPFDEPVATHKSTITSYIDHNYPVPAISPGQSPDFDVVTFSGERASKAEGVCPNKYGIQIYMTPDKRCIAYDGHNGLDYDLDVGDPIHPAAAGTLFDISSTNISPPWLLKIKHVARDGSEYVTSYGHIEPNPDLLTAWQDASDHELPVDISQTIGTITSVAGHLHFMVQHDDKYIDPYGWSGSYPDPLEVHNSEPGHCLWRFGCDTEVVIQASTGGALRSIEDDVYASIPANAHPTALAYQIVGVPAFSEIERPTGLGTVGHAFLLRATTTDGDVVEVMEAPVKLQVWYDLNEASNILKGTEQLYRWNGSKMEWELMVSSRSQTGDNSLIASTSELGLFALLGQPHFESYLPFATNSP
jgi:murein DD-endopeptidase MepM/ murein hydrolase activator NlpD